MPTYQPPLPPAHPVPEADSQLVGLYRQIILALKAIEQTESSIDQTGAEPAPTAKTRTPSEHPDVDQTEVHDESH